MRLINARTLELEEFLDEPPRYAILSHTWGKEEVTLPDMASEKRASMAGFSKIEQTCRLALAYDLRYAWVDTCCIDKSSSAELTEAINSMFRWYRKARLCFAMLEDLLPDADNEAAIPRCRWFTRGWTLQELIASQKMYFYDSTWRMRGTKDSLRTIIEVRTSIPGGVLSGRKAPSAYSVATRMSWAAARQTTRMEDRAYSLLGLFEVNMPLLYGEREKAFRRLQEEIIKRNNDLTIFAWEDANELLVSAVTPDSAPLPPSEAAAAHYRHHTNGILGLFAPSPASFALCSNIVPYSNDFENFSVTNRGLFLSGEVPVHILAADIPGLQGEPYQYGLMLGYHNQGLADSLSPASLRQASVGIYLRKVGPNLLYRDRRLPLAGHGRSTFRHLRRVEHSGCYIMTDAPLAKGLAASASGGFSPYGNFRHLTVHVPRQQAAAVALQDVVPEALWDPTDRIVLRPNPYGYIQDPIAVGLRFECEVGGRRRQLVLVCKYGSYGDVADKGMSGVGPAPVVREVYDARGDDGGDGTTAEAAAGDGGGVAVLMHTLFPAANHSREAGLIFSGRHRKEHIFWADLAAQVPIINSECHAAEFDESEPGFGQAKPLHRVSVTLWRQPLVRVLAPGGPDVRNVQTFTLCFSVSRIR